MNLNKTTWEQAVCILQATEGMETLVKACYYDVPLLAACKRYAASIEWMAIQRILGDRRGRAIDVGAGRGIAAYALAKDGWHTIALEPDPSPIVGAEAIRALAKEASLDINVVETWGEHLPFSDSTFDLVFCRQVLHHARDLEAFCREVSRVLRPNGIFLALREHVISKPEHLTAFLDAHPLQKYYGGEHAYLLKDYIACIEQADLVVEKIFNPFASEINTFPLAFSDVKKRMAKKIHFPFPGLIPDWVLRMRGATIHSPGRIYSFVARKSAQNV